MAADYYRVTLEKIRDLLAKGDKVAASGLINQELALPYVPQDFADELHKLQVEQVEQTTKSLISDPDELRTLLKAGLLEQITAIDNLRHLNCHNYQELLADYFSDDPDSQAAGLLIDVLIAQEIKQEFSYRKQGKLGRFRATELSHPYATVGYQICLQTLVDLLEANYPSELQLAKELLLIYSYRLLPEQIPSETAESLANAVCYQIFKELDNLGEVDKVLKDPEATQALNRQIFNF